MSGAMAVVIIDGDQTKVSSQTGEIVLVRVKVSCRLDSPRYRVPGNTFSNGAGSILATFPSTTRLEIRFDFKEDDTTTNVLEKTVELGDWIGKMAKEALGQTFDFPCDVYLALTDRCYPYSDPAGNVTALGGNGEFDSPAVVIMGNKGYLVHIGVSTH